MWELTDGTRHPTGYWAEELATPHRIFSEAGWSIDIATPGGVAPTAEKSSLGIAGGMPGHRRRITAYLDAIAADLTHPIPLDRVDETQYDLVFYPGGHGVMPGCPQANHSNVVLPGRPWGHGGSGFR